MSTVGVRKKRCAIFNDVAQSTKRRIRLNSPCGLSTLSLIPDLEFVSISGLIHIISDRSDSNFMEQLCSSSCLDYFSFAFVSLIVGFCLYTFTPVGYFISPTVLLILESL